MSAMYTTTGAHNQRRRITGSVRAAEDTEASRSTRQLPRNRRASVRRTRAAPWAGRASAWRKPSTRTARTRPSSRSGWSFATFRDVECVEDDEHVEQTGHDHERIAVLVGDRHDTPRSDSDGLRDEVREADAEVCDECQRNERLGDLKREETALEPQAIHEHQRQRYEEDDPLLPPTLQEVSETRNHPGSGADQIDGGWLGAVGRRGTHCL